MTAPHDDRPVAPTPKATTDRTGDAERNWPISTVLALIGFVFVPFMVTITGVAGGDESADQPPDSLEFAHPPPADDGGLEPFERWFERRVPGRELAVEFERTTTRLLDDRYAQAVADSDRVVMGEDGWLFLTDAIDQPCFGDDQVAEWLTEIDAARRLLAATGRRLIVAVAPDRGLVIPERLGPIANDCQRSNAVVVDLLADRAAVVDLSTVVNEERHVLQLDTHWSPEGALAAAGPIVEAVSPGAWSEPRVISETVSRPGDLDQLVGYDNTETVNLVSIVPDRPPRITSEPTSIPGRPLVRVVNPGALDLTVLVVHDSYGGLTDPADPTVYLPGYGIDYLRPWFGEVANVRLEGWDATLLGQAPTSEALAEADVLVAVFVQRMLPYRFATGQLTGPLVAALTDELPSTDLPGSAGGAGWSTDPVPTVGAVVIGGLTAPSTDITVTAVSGSVTDRTELGDRLVVTVTAGTALQIGAPDPTVSFVPFAAE